MNDFGHRQMTYYTLSTHPSASVSLNHHPRHLLHLLIYLQYVCTSYLCSILMLTKRATKSAFSCFFFFSSSSFNDTATAVTSRIYYFQPFQPTKPKPLLSPFTYLSIYLTIIHGSWIEMFEVFELNCANRVRVRERETFENERGRGES